MLSWNVKELLSTLHSVPMAPCFAAQLQNGWAGLALPPCLCSSDLSSVVLCLKHGDLSRVSTSTCERRTFSVVGTSVWNGSLLATCGWFCMGGDITMTMLTTTAELVSESCFVSTAGCCKVQCWRWFSTRGVVNPFHFDEGPRWLSNVRLTQWATVSKLLQAYKLLQVHFRLHYSLYQLISLKDI